MKCENCGKGGELGFGFKSIRRYDFCSGDCQHEYFIRDAVRTLLADEEFMNRLDKECYDVANFYGDGLRKALRNAAGMKEGK